MAILLRDDADGKHSGSYLFPGKHLLFFFLDLLFQHQNTARGVVMVNPISPGSLADQFIRHTRHFLTERLHQFIDELQSRAKVDGFGCVEVFEEGEQMLIGPRCG